jgi:hypothetical protein
MTKMIVFMMLFLPSMFGFSPASETATCDCSDITNLQETGQTSSSISYAWGGSLNATRYKLWYYRSEDQYTSGYFYTNSTAYTFTSLAAGHYTFYFVAECESEESNAIGVEDVFQI